ncbi:uncharacterized protein LOC125231067 isoform X1 [Leguminivora glycinivorella]|uniref:uncharacterized protein LOC125231067 isoform X1 n=1 Tax=Leguminivora glycinivorella TaxID=1035111 RepID=UPI00200FF1B5|nr:uncharacterized protein LOC125231067 isoform X1 [Leguminivora glycinivorella]
MKLILVVSILLCLLKPCLSQSGQWTGFAENECLCTTQYDPVCGSDMRRYYNICTYECRLDYIRRNGLNMIDKIDCKWLPPPSPIH